MSTKTELLNAIRDIHEPSAPEVTSPLWMLIGLTFALIMLSLLLVKWLKQKDQPQPSWANQLILARKEPPEKARLRLARLLRHICVNKNKHVANTLSGQAWLQHLDKTLTTDYFTQGEGQLFGDPLYAPVCESHDFNRICDSLAQVFENADSTTIAEAA